MDNKDNYIVDVGEQPGTAGAWNVTATSRTGEVETAVFTGRRAPELALAYVDAIKDFEKRPPTEYPKYVRRGGVQHLVLDKKHEESIGPMTDEDKAHEEGIKKHVEESKKHHDHLEEARERMVAQVEPPPIRAPGEDDPTYSERLARWQD